MKFLLVLAFVHVAVAANAPLTVPLHVAYQNKQYYAYVDASIGTPAQPINLGLDLFSTDTYIVDAISEVDCKNGNPKFFDYTASSTYKLLQNFTENYNDSYLIEDTVQIGGAKFAKSQFNVTDHYIRDWDCGPIGGTLGMGQVTNRKGPLLTQILANYDKKVITISPDKKNTKDPKVPQLTLTIGGSDDKGCSSDWVEAPCTGIRQFTYPACTFGFYGYSLGDYITKRTYAIGSAAATLERLIYVSSSIMGTFQSQVKSYNQSYHALPCDGEYPDFGIVIGKTQLTMPGRFYVGEKIEGNFCEFLMLKGSDDGLSDSLINLPLGFFSTNCQKIDYATGKSYFAPAL